MSEKFSTMRKSADSLESADSLGENQGLHFLEQFNYRVKQQEIQRESHEKIDRKDHKKADSDLEKELSYLEISNQSELNDFLVKNFPNNLKAKIIAENYFKKQNIVGISITSEELKRKLDFDLNESKELSNEGKIKTYTESIRQGKSQTEILQLLISKFENKEAVSTWVENWRNFQKLHQFAESKPPQEQKAIQNIISKADFTSESAFSTSLKEISQSEEISDETKFEISREFGGEHIESVDGMN